MHRGWLVPFALLLGGQTAATGGTRLFVADEHYRVVWLVDADSGVAVRGISIPDVAGGGFSRVGPRAFQSGLAFDGQDLYYTNATSRYVWALDPYTGAVRRELEKPAPNLSGLATDGSTLFAVSNHSDDGVVLSLDPEDGSPLGLLRVPGARRALAIDRVRRVVFTSVGSLEIRAVTNVPNAAPFSFSYAPPAPMVELAYSDVTDTLFGLGTDGMLYALLPENGTVVSSVRITIGDNGERITGSSLAAADALAEEKEDPADDADGTDEEEPSAFTLKAQETVINGREPTPVPILLTSPYESAGYSIALLHDPSVLHLGSIDVSERTGLGSPDFVGTQILSNGGTLGVVIDMFPFERKKLPPSKNRVIAEYNFLGVQSDLRAPTETELRFVNGVLGEPVKENLLLLDEGSARPQITVGRVTCIPSKPVGGGPKFYCGGPLDAAGVPAPLSAGPGERVEIGFYYSYEEAATGIQGLTMALAYDCFLACQEDSFLVPTNSITSEVAAEFVEFSCENDPDDGDGCEMTLGILVDEFPPFDGRLLPLTAEALLLASVTLDIDRTAPIGECLEIRFRDGVDSRQAVPVNNLVSIQNRAVPAELSSCEVCVTPVKASLYCGADTLDDRGVPEPLVGERGDEVEVFFWYRSPREDLFGFTQALRFDCQLECRAETFRLADDLAELSPDVDVLFQCDNDPGDADGCELVLTVTTSGDGEPPVVLPATRDTTQIGRVTLRVAEDTPRGACLQLEHIDQINGAGGENVSNTVEFNARSGRPDTVDCQVCVPPDKQTFFCGGPELGDDNLPVEITEAVRGEPVELSLWYSSPVDLLGDNDQVQGLTMALSFDCNLTCVEDSIRFPADSITAEIVPEFFSFDCDNEPLDGDGCEMIFGLLVQAAPPFEEITLPPTDVPLKVAAVDMLVSTEAPPNSCFAVEFRDKVNGSTLVPVRNLIAAENRAISPQTVDCKICAGALGPKFICGGPELGSDNRPTTPRGLAGEAVELCFW